MVLKILSRLSPVKKRRRRIRKRVNRQNIVSRTITTVRKLHKPQTLLIPGFIKHKYNQVTGLHPRKRLAFEMAKARNKRLNALRDYLKNSLRSFTKSMLQSSLTNDSDTRRHSQKVCVNRQLRHNEVMRKTRGKGLKVKNAVWTPVSRLVRCEVEKKKRKV